MRYELECGHCGYQFVLGAAELPRTMKCAVCGGVLAIVVAHPVAPAVAPPPAPVPPPPEPVKPKPKSPVPIAPPFVPAGTDSPEDWSRFAEPWQSVCFGLWLVRNGAVVAGALWVALHVIGATAILAVPPAQRGRAENLLWVLAAAHLVPAGLHVAGQLRCQAVSDSYGRRFVTAGCVLSLLSCVCPCCLASVNDGEFVAGTTAQAVGALNLVAFGLWLGFLGRLGDRLRAAELVAAVREFHVRFWAGLALLTAFLVTAYRARTGNGPLWMCLIGADAIGFYLLWRYVALLRTATRAVARRATAAPSA